MDEQQAPAGQKPVEDPDSRNSLNNKSKSVAVVAVVIIIIAGVMYLSRKSSVPSQPIAGETELSTSIPSTPSGSEVKIFNLSAKPFEFSVKEIRVKKGDRVRINLAIEQGMHDWVLDEFGARTPQLKTGESGTVEFIADKAGTFEYYCSVPTHRQRGMVGKLIVE